MTIARQGKLLPRLRITAFDKSKVTSKLNESYPFYLFFPIGISLIKLKKKKQIISI